MIAETGHFALILALGIALFQTVVPMLGAARGHAAWMDSARPAAVARHRISSAPPITVCVIRASRRIARQ